MVKEHLHYIDVAKGLLIIMVVYGHIYGNTSEIDNAGVDYIHQSVNLFVSFYMPCFFVITGYCSNFKKSFLEMASSSLRTIILPGISLSILIFIAQLNFTKEAFINLGMDILFYGGRYWFLSALFVGRLLYWICSQHAKEITSILCVLSFIIGYALGICYHGVEYWWFVHALLLMPYLGIGQILKRTNVPNVKMASSLFFLMIALTISFSHYGWLRIDYFYHVPGITQKLLNINLTMFIPLVLLSVSGSLWIISMCRMISRNKLLEYLGKNSLIIYCVHGALLAYFIPKIAHGGDDLGVLEFCIRILIAYLLTLCFSSLIAYILNLKYLKVVIGKF